MTELSDIQELDHIKQLVDSFYDKIRVNELLGPIFNHIIQDRWPEHLEKMYRFWQTILLEEHTYQGSPFLPHAKLPVNKTHFDEWLRIFNQTVDELFKGEKAEQAKWRANRMALMFLAKIEYYQNNSSIPLM
ncbi:group III truncated hemoglobin [Pedobacter montanisoli]|uniref:Group III truncated hemoglobin n=1 Tax=Pedobacter montanisoli TaxID=2923277 RepID=A0ABS9ZXG3_9SPHI|nr:group III truncated hemoglobin [Pedobacter montanisoli]MCJ0742984.1 group III truncated hemoglobin [Pedobacter montanisoli]